MPTQVIQTGGTVRVVVDPRGVASVEVINGDLIVTYNDGTIENAGYIGGGGGSVAATIFNTAGISSLDGVEVQGFTDAADSIDARLTALGF